MLCFWLIPCCFSFSFLKEKKKRNEKNDCLQKSCWYIKIYDDVRMRRRRSLFGLLNLYSGSFWRLKSGVHVSICPHSFIIMCWWNSTGPLAILFPSNFKKKCSNPVGVTDISHTWSYVFGIQTYMRWRLVIWYEFKPLDQFETYLQMFSGE